jgi:hypothetical protein
MAQELTLKTNDTPSYFNKDALLGGSLGFVVGMFALNTVLPGAGFIIGAAGAVLGSLAGKARMESENRNGKKVSEEPSFFSKDTAIGGLIGAALTPLGILAGIAAGGAIALGISATAPVAAALVLGGTVIGAATPPLVGALMGNYIGKSSQRSEYEQARQQTIVDHLNKTVSPEVGAAVEYSMQHGKDWSKQVVEDRLLAEAQGHQHGHHS